MRKIVKAVAAVVSIVIIAGVIAILLCERRATSDATRWQTTLLYLAEIYDTKMLHSLIATHYAVIAEAENQHPTATLLRAIAKSEEVQYENCRRAIATLGGEEVSAKTDRRTATTISHNNLHAIIDYKIAYRSHLARYARHATLSDNRYVARLLLWCDESDTRQIEFLRRQIATAHHPQQILIGRFYVCPTCSNLFDEEFHSHLCPLCMTSAERFFVFE